MATRDAHINAYEDLLHCMICFELYRSPKMMQCAHTFCCECLQGYQNTYQQQRRAVPGKLPCPTCRELTTLPSNGVSGLKNDFKVKKIEEMFKTMNFTNSSGPASKSSRMCDSCRAQKKNSQAKVFCALCSMSYCNSCLNKHNKNPLFKEHNVVDKTSTMEKNGSDEFLCRVHEGERGKYFCKSCETMVCTLCLIHGHEGHDVVEVDAMFVQLQQDIKNLKNIVEAKMGKLKKKVVELETLRQFNLSSCHQAEIDIKEKTKTVIDILKKQEKDLLEQLRRRRDERLKQLAEEVERVNFTISKALGVAKFAASTAHGQSMRRIALSEELIQRMRTVAETDATVTDSRKSAVITFIANRQDPSLGRIDEIKGTLDTLTNVGFTTSIPAAGTGRTGMNRSISQIESEAEVRPTLLLNINKYGSGKGELRDPLGVACMLNGDIVATEWGNKRLQLFNGVGQSMMIVASGQIAPQGVAVTLKGNIIITDGHNKRLQVFTPSGSTIARWGLGKFYGPCGVAISPNGNCVVTDVGEHTVSIFRGEKTLVERFGTKGPAEDQFANPLYVASGQHNEIVVSDSDNHCLKIFDSRGRFVRKIGAEGTRDGQLRYPRGVCSDHEGNIIVADRNNDRVSLFSAQGAFIRHLLTKQDGIRDPYAVAISITGNVVITESGQNRAAIKMFQV